MFSHRQPDGVRVDILAWSIDKDDELSFVQKAERAIQIGLPILDVEVIPTAMRWVANADRLNATSEAIEQLREMLNAHAGQKNKPRGRKIKPTPVLEQPLWDKLLSEE